MLQPKYVSHKVVTTSKKSSLGAYETDGDVNMKTYISFREGQVTLFCEQVEPKIQLIKFVRKLGTKTSGNEAVADAYSGCYAPNGNIIITYQNITPV